MKTFIIIAHMLLGLALVFINVNNLLYLANVAIQSPAQQYYYGVPLSQGSAEAILGTILGLFSIIGALAFRKDKRWATLTLPLLPLALGLWMVYGVYSAPKSEVAWTGGIIIFTALILFIFFISEILYITLRKKIQLSQF